MENIRGQRRPFLSSASIVMADFRINIADSSVRYGRNTGATRGLTDMNFALTDRQAHFSNKVRDFMEEHVRPKAAEYLAQSASQPRWKVLPVFEELAAPRPQQH
jgi:hypothetical protein